MSNSPVLNKSLTDWERLDAPEITPEMFAKAVVRRGLNPAPKKQQITLKAFQDTDAGKNIVRSQGKEELFEKLEI